MDTYRSPKDIAKTVRENLKKELPAWKFSVTSDYHSISMYLMSGPEPVTADGAGYAQLNHYQLLDMTRGNPQLMSNGCRLTPTGWDVMRKACQNLAAEHWDKSEVQIDYFNCNYYMHVSIGKWDKDYQAKEG